MSNFRRVSIGGLPRIQEAQREPCCLYVIREADSDAFKIGVTVHPLRRVSSLQAGNRRKLVICAVYAGQLRECLFIERACLRHFGARHGTEWVAGIGLDQITKFINGFCEAT